MKGSNSSTTLSRVQNTSEESVLKKVQPAINNPWLGGGGMPVQLPKYSKNIDAPRRTVKPENDILYQWRLARKMEVAAEAVTKEKQPFIANRKLTEDALVGTTGDTVEKPAREKHLSKNDCDESEVGKQNQYSQEASHQKSDIDIDHHKEFLRNNRHLTTATCSCSVSKSDAKNCNYWPQTHHMCPLTRQSLTQFHCCYACVPSEQSPRQEFKPQRQQESPPKNKSTGTQVSLKEDLLSEESFKKVYKKNALEEKEEKEALIKNTTPIIKQVWTNYLVQINWFWLSKTKHCLNHVFRKFSSKSLVLEKLKSRWVGLLMA